MAEPPSSPFTGLGLDKALLRSTQQRPPIEPAPQAAQPTVAPRPRKSASRVKRQAIQPTREPKKQLASGDASVLASYREDLIDSIRRTVKTPGKEVAFVRLSPEEKTDLADIVYTYKRQRRKTTETEVARIAVNFILEDYKTNGETSVLARVLDALLA